jgi:hypothetical protein
MLAIDLNEIDRRDLAGRESLFLATMLRVRRKIVDWYLASSGKQFWRRHSLMTAQEFHSHLTRAITQVKPLAVGRLGGVEASMLMWAESIGKLPWLTGNLFSDTSLGATNAGIRPRNHQSYRLFASLCRQAMENLDCQGVWRTAYEARCLGRDPRRMFFDVETTAPDASNRGHWMEALQGKRVLVVSPFETTINEQIPRLAEVWPRASWMRGARFTCVKFPYLIDAECDEAWWEVYDRIALIISRAEYDVALFGCGGLGLPFTQVAKSAGRVGLHLGGHLQLIFGVYGRRHLEQEWHAKHINEAWVRPRALEVANSASRVESGCYW